MENNSKIDDRPLRIPPIAWSLGLGLIAALVAIFIFNVAFSTVVYYSFFAIMMGNHFFMHGSHSGHGGSAGHQSGPASNNAESDRADTDKDEHASHTGGCH